MSLQSPASVSRSPINQLPRELFLQILLYVHLRDRICSTHVCQHWRCVALAAPDLWNEFTGWSTDEGGLDDATAVLARSGTVPITLDLLVSHSCEELGELLNQHMNHTRSLQLDVSLEFSRGGRGDLLAPLLHALEQPAPMLKELTLQVSRLPLAPTDVYLPDNLFADAGSMLDTLRLSNVALRSDFFPALSGLRFLYLAQSNVDFLRIVELYPRLQQLHVGTLSLISSEQEVTAYSLELLDINSTVRAVAMVCSQLRCVRPLTVWMHLMKADVLRYVLASTPKHTLRRLRLYIHFPSLARCLELGYNSGMTWVLGPTVSTPVTELVLQDAALMSNITVLTLHELQWPLHLSALMVPSLRRLTLVLDSFAAPGSSVMTSITQQESAGLLYEDIPSALHCPVLGELCIASPTVIPAVAGFLALAVDVHDVCAFIATRLRFADRELARLTLRNVHLEDPTRGIGMQALTAAVSAIEYRSAKQPRIPYIHQKGTGFLMDWVYYMND